MGFWGPATLIGDARRRGIAILLVDIHHSQGRCTLEGGGIRLGFNYVDGFGEAGIARLLASRQTGDFTDLADLCRWTRLPRRLVERLIRVGALDSWTVPRRQLLWVLGQLPDEDEGFDWVFPAEAVELPVLTQAEALAAEYEILGLSPGQHVMALYRPWLAERGILSSRELRQQPAGRLVSVAGLVVVHQSPPTAHNVHFITLETEDGLIDVVIRPHIYTRYRKILHTTPLLLVKGIVQQDNGVVSVLARQISTLDF